MARIFIGTFIKMPRKQKKRLVKFRCPNCGHLINADSTHQQYAKVMRCTNQQCQFAPCGYEWMLIEDIYVHSIARDLL